MNPYPTGSPDSATDIPPKSRVLWAMMVSLGVLGNSIALNRGKTGRKHVDDLYPKTRCFPRTEGSLSSAHKDSDTTSLSAEGTAREGECRWPDGFWWR